MKRIVKKDQYLLSEGKDRVLMLRTIPFEPDLWERIKQVAQQEDRSAASFVRLAVREKILQHELKVIS